MTLIIIAGAILAYCVVAMSVHRRLGWYAGWTDGRHGKSYMDTDAAWATGFLSWCLLPVAIIMLVGYGLGKRRAMSGYWLPPRNVRRAEKIKAQEARIAELERQIDRELKYPDAPW